MPGKTRLFQVQMLKSSMVLMRAVMVPGSISYADIRKQKSRSTRCNSGSRGCTTSEPIMPIAICTISSACGWYMNVPDCLSSNS